MDLKYPTIDKVLHKSLFRFDPYDFEPQIMVEKYIAPFHLGEYWIAYLSMEIVVYNYAFSEDH